MQLDQEPAFPSSIRPEKKPRGCCFQGCIALVVLGLILGGGLGWSMLQVANLFRTFTADTPATLPSFEPEPGALAALEQRFASFLGEDRAGQPVTERVTELRLTANDLNTLVSSADGWSELKNKVFFFLGNGRIKLQTALPLSGIPLLEGRYLNGTLTLKPVITKERFQAGIESFEVGDKKLPKYLVYPLDRGLSEVLRQGEGDVTPLIRGIDSIQVIDDLLVIKADPPNEVLSQ